MEDSELLRLTSGVVKKLMPTFQKDTSSSPSEQLKSLINSMNTHFESLEKSIEIKAKNKFESKRFSTLMTIITNDRGLLDTCVKRIQDALLEGGNIYKSCLSPSKFVADIEKKIMENKKTLASILQYFNLL